MTNIPVLAQELPVVNMSEPYRRAIEFARSIELFLVESPENKYQPEPPDGWFGLRSNKRRIFMRLNGTSVPPPDEIQARIDRGDYVDAGS
jgi:hypothetical protein